MDIYELEGEDLRAFLRQVAGPTDSIRKVSIALDEGVKVKVNELTWTRPLGQMRP